MPNLVKSIDFDRVAHWYDAYVTADFDLPFWTAEARRHPEPRLELMCGTGRISLAILQSGLSLTCADYSAPMLAVLLHKLRQRDLTAPVIEADARSLNLNKKYAWIFIGFHSFAEISDADEQAATLNGIARHLLPGGVFTLSLQNPVVRGPQLDGRWKELGVFQLAGENKVRVSGSWKFDPPTGLVTGAQHYQEILPDGRIVADLEIPIHFRLLGAGDFKRMAAAAGFRVLNRWGDYDRSSFDERQSPFMIYNLSLSPSTKSTS